MDVTDKQILTWKWNGKDKRINVGDPLYLMLREYSKTFQIRKKVRGKTTTVSIGKSPTMTLTQAKAEVADIKKNKTVNSMTIATLIEDYTNEVVKVKSKVPKQIIGYLNHIESVIGHAKVSSLTTFELVEIIRAYSVGRARSGDRLRTTIKSLLDYALNRGIVNANPVQHITKEVTGYINIPRKRVLTKAEIKMVWEWNNNKSGWQKTEQNKRVILFLLLTYSLSANQCTNFI